VRRQGLGLARFAAGACGTAIWGQNIALALRSIGRGAGGEPGNAGRSVRDPGRRRMQNIDAGALVGLVRRKGRVGYMGCRRP
jgi:hypothetical protein